MLDELRAAGKLGLDTVVVGGSHMRALTGGAHDDLRPVNRARHTSKHHLLTDSRGDPLVVTLAGGHRHDMTQLLPLVDVLPVMRRVRVQPRLRPHYLYADRGCDCDVYRRALRELGIIPPIARRGVVHGSGLDHTRWVVERR
ncbi:hypothetical protein GCM10027586_10480 [Kineococcus gypseus]|uniref:transposase n=1 Tax=Kineococcus gypseus TaxID=1637102 RepID=UPI003D7F0BA5